MIREKDLMRFYTGLGLSFFGIPQNKKESPFTNIAKRLLFMLYGIDVS